MLPPSAVQLFGDIGSCMMTLTTIALLGDNLAQTYNAIARESMWLYWLFVAFQVVGGITLVNMITGILSQVIEETAKQEHMTRSLNDMRASMAEAFEMFDITQDGRICREEWAGIKDLPSVRQTLQRLFKVEGNQVDGCLEHMGKMLFGTPGAVGNAGSPVQSKDASLDEFIETFVDVRPDCPCSILEMVLFQTTSQADDRLTRVLDQMEADLTTLIFRFSAAGHDTWAQEALQGRTLRHDHSACWCTHAGIGKGGDVHRAWKVDAAVNPRPPAGAAVCVIPPEEPGSSDVVELTDGWMDAGPAGPTSVSDADTGDPVATVPAEEAVQDQQAPGMV